MAAKRKSDGGGLGPHVRALRGGRTDFDPQILRVVLQWLTMLRRRYSESHAAHAGRAGTLPNAVRAGVCRRLSQLADAAGVLMHDAVAPWSRVEWHRAAADLAAELERCAELGELPGGRLAERADAAPTGGE